MKYRSLGWLTGLGFAVSAAACGDDVVPSAGPGTDGGVGDAGDSGPVADGQAEGDSGPVIKPGPPGTLDTKFGKDGVASWPLPATAAPQSSIDTIKATTQPDGKVLFAFAGRNTTNIFVTRLDETGQVDPSFGAGGTQTTSVVPGGVGTSFVTGIFLQPDGKVLVAGAVSPTLATQTSSPKYSMVVARYLPTGTLDGSFNSGGVFATKISTSDAFGSIALQPDGKILLGGACFDGTAANICILRLSSSGTRDSSFGTDGLASTSLVNDSPESVQDLRVLSDGRILAAVSTSVPTNVGSSRSYMAIRYESDGAVDGTFGTGGTLTTRFDTANRSNDQLSALLLQADGSFVLAGNHELTEIPAVRSFGFTKVTANGSLDTSYGLAGYLTLDPGETVFVPRAVSSGSDVVSLGVHGGTSVRTWLTRAKSTGVVDATFGKQGFTKVFEGQFPVDLARPVSQRAHVVGIGPTSVSVLRVWL